MVAYRDGFMRDHEGRSAARLARHYRRGGMDCRRLPVGRAERRGQLLVGVVVDVDKAEIVILAVCPAALRMVVVLEPMRPDDRRDAGKVERRRGGAARPL